VGLAPSLAGIVLKLPHSGRLLLDAVPVVTHQSHLEYLGCDECYGAAKISTRLFREEFRYFGVTLNHFLYPKRIFKDTWSIQSPNSTSL
jgi:hypothetical protein